MAVYSLFEPNDPSFNSCTNLHIERMGLYIRGYEKATEVLLSEVVENRVSLDTLIHPIMFNYRHYLELSFKELSWLCKQITKEKHEFTIDLNGTKKFEKYDNNAHGLSKYWQVVLSDLRAIDSSLPKELVVQINKTVEELNKLDKNGQEFRYPEKKNWQNTLNDQQYINIISVAKNFSETRDRINQLFCWLDSLIEIPCENPPR